MTKPLRVSWSGLRSHEECHQKSYLIREGKRSKVSNIRNFFAGMVVDRIMRDWLDDPALRDADIRGVVTCAMDEMESTERGKGNMVRWRDAADRDQIRQFCVDLVVKLGPILSEHVLPHTYEHGKWFKVPMTLADQDGQPRDILLTGEMDLLVDNRGPVVWDLKGTADDQYYRKVAAQLVFYDLAVWASTGIKTRFVGLIQPMCTEPVLAWEVTDNARRELLARIQRYAHDVWANDTTCTDQTGACHFCDVRHACARYGTPQLDAFGSLADGLRHAAGEPA